MSIDHPLRIIEIKRTENNVSVALAGGQVVHLEPSALVSTENSRGKQVQATELTNQDCLIAYDRQINRG